MGDSTPEQYGLAEPRMLEKIDKLFACGVGELVDLPQIVVVGDQSSGKSSVLEALIKKPLPRDSGLCTRFATQIVFRRAVQERIFISILPDRDASAEHIQRVKTFGRQVPSLDSDTFKKVMQEAHQVMGLSSLGDEVARKPTFSRDVLRLEISGPDQEHLTVIDVPGIFRDITEGRTTKADIQLVRSIIKVYMDNPRSVMLAVVPANVDVATQEILQMAAETDIYGDRTLGVLTKPDLVDKGSEHNVVDLAEGRARPMKLGWHIIRNLGQKELQNTALNRSDLEANFFRTEAPWNSVGKDKVGVDALRIRLREVLGSLVKREFPKVGAEIKSQLEAYRKRLDDLGPERAGAADYSIYLTHLATKFQRLVFLAMNANHGGDEAFEANAALRVAPAVMSRMKTFSDEMGKYGGLYAFMPQSSSSSSSAASETDSADEDDASAADKAVPEGDGKSRPGKSFNVRKQDNHEDLVDLLHPPKILDLPAHGKIRVWLSEIYQGNRGFELGTFNPSILPTAMNKQASKWSDISMGFVSDVIVMVHDFIDTGLMAVCGDVDIRDELMCRLSDELMRRYQKAIDGTKFLLQVERSHTPTTMNHYFNDNVQKSRQGYDSARLKHKAFYCNMSPSGKQTHVVEVNDAIQSTRSMSNEEHVIQDIHDNLHSYYKVSRKTFVDNVCRQAAIHYLLTCSESPLALFSPVFVSQLSDSAREEIAGEAPRLKRLRKELSKQIESLAMATKILAR